MSIHRVVSNINNELVLQNAAGFFVIQSLLQLRRQHEIVDKVKVVVTGSVFQTSANEYSCYVQRSLNTEWNFQKRPSSIDVKKIISKELKEFWIGNTQGIKQDKGPIGYVEGELTLEFHTHDRDNPTAASSPTRFSVPYKICSQSFF